MRRLVTAWFLLIAGLVVFAQAQAPSIRQVILYQMNGCPASNFVSRISNPSASDNINYTKLICGLFSDGIMAGGDLISGCGPKLDVLYIFAAKDEATSELNLCSTKYTAVKHGSPTLTAYAGWKGVAGSTTDYLDTTFNPTTAGGNTTQNSAHVSIWSNNNAQLGATEVGAISAISNASSKWSEIIARLNSDNSNYYRINDAPTISNFFPSGVTSAALLFANRDSATTQQGYNCPSNGSCAAQSFTAATTSGLPNTTYLVLIRNGNGTPNAGDGTHTFSMVSIGSSLSASDVTKLFNRVGTYRTAVGL